MIIRLSNNSKSWSVSTVYTDEKNFCRAEAFSLSVSAVFSFPESSFHLKSLIWTLLCVFLFIYSQNFLGLDLHSWEIFSCSCCKRLTVVCFTLLRMLLYSFSIASLFILIQLFQSLCFLLINRFSSAVKGWKLRFLFNWCSARLGKVIHIPLVTTNLNVSHISSTELFAGSRTASQLMSKNSVSL